MVSADPLTHRPACRWALLSFLVILALGMATVAEAATPTPLGPGASAPPELATSFEDAAVLATGLTPGGEGLVFSISRVPLGYTQRVEHRIEPVLVDPLGEAYYEIEDGAPVPAKSVWAVVDPITGLYAIGSPQGSPRSRSVTLPAPCPSATS